MAGGCVDQPSAHREQRPKVCRDASASRKVAAGGREHGTLHTADERAEKEDGTAKAADE